jgi:hypothetical protein
MSMPPFAWWLRGRADIAAALAHGDFCAGTRPVPTSVNGSPAFGQYGPDGPFALVTLDVSRAGITSITTHLDLPGEFARYGLSPRPMSSRVRVVSAGMSEPTVSERTEQPYVAIPIKATLLEWGEVNALVPEAYAWLAGSRPRAPSSTGTAWWAGSTRSSPWRSGSRSPSRPTA